MCTGNENSEPILNKFIIRKIIIETNQVVLNFCRTVYIKEHYFLHIPFYLKPPYRTASWEQYLKKICYDPSNPASFTGSENSYSDKNPSALKRSFKRNKVIVKGIDDQWDVDLMDMTKFD